MMSTSSIVTLFITSENSSSERRFDKSITISTFKERLEAITGVPAAYSKLSLYNNENVLIANIDDDSKMLYLYLI